MNRARAAIRFDARLVEEAVLSRLACARAEERRSFHSERDPIYELATAERESAFRELHAAWFDRLGLAGPLLELLDEQPSILRSIAGCLVSTAARRREEHADLRERQRPRSGGRSRQRPVLILQLLPATLVGRDALGRLLRHELYYIADMLDPAFGYDPELAVRQTSGALAGLLRERHEVLWRVTVEGRLAARGHHTAPELERLRSRFDAAFPMLGGSGPKTFRALFEGPRPCHGELMRMATQPAGEGHGSSVCPLCRMPAGKLERTSLSKAAMATARRDFAHWRPEDGMCGHCADLYELRQRARPTTSTVL